MDSTQILYSSEKPVSFLSWLELKERTSPDLSINFKQYQDYIITWFGRVKNKSINSDQFFTDLYVDLMRELTLNFSTEEEKRFITNFDYTKKENFDIIIPFFVSKLKALCIYYSNRRENLKNKIATLPYRGTNRSVIKVVKDIILREVERGSAQKLVEGKTTIPKLSSINQFLDVRVDELYDDKNYFDTKETNNIEIINYPVDKDLYNNFANAIIKAINQYPTFIDKLKFNLSVNIPLSGNEINLLKERDFINFLKNNNTNNLKLNLLKQIAPKYLSSDFYYLSVGNTFSDVASGILFDTKDYKGEKLQNPLNREASIVASVQSLENLYTAYEIGKFFIPSKTGVLQYNTHKKTFSLNYNKLTTNTVYVFPDPTVSESLENYTPLLYKVNLDWNKIGAESDFCFGDVLTDKQYQRFYGYESLSQDVLNQPYGLSLSVDDTDFWTGEGGSTWTQDSLWPGLDKVEELALTQRTESLLINAGIPVEWYSDIYGNEFALYKDFNTNVSVSDKKANIPGKLYVKNTTSGLVSSFNHHFSRLINKYPKAVADEISNEIFSFYVIKNVVVLETKNYVTVDSYDFDYVSKKFINTLLPGVFIPKYTINSYLEKFINTFYVDKTNDLYLCFLKLIPDLSASNYKSIYPVIYKVNLDKLDLEQMYPSSSFKAWVYSLSSTDYKTFAEIDLRYIEGGKFSYDDKSNLFNLTYYAYNLNNIPYIINEQFSYNNESNLFYSFVPLLHKPYYYVNDINFSNSNYNSNLRLGSTYSETIGSNTNGVFTWANNQKDSYNYHFCSDISPVFINTAGNHYVQFDWDKYVYGNVFIGCDNLGVTKVDIDNIIDFRDGSPVIRLTNEESWYRISNFNFNNITYTLSARRPYNTNNSIIEFSISSPVSSSDVPFCNDLLSVYRYVKIIKLGTGDGTILSKPYCIDCGDTCEFLYPINNTITFLPSAAKDCFFSGWKGSDCEGLASSCLLTVTDNTVLTAIFNKIPSYNLTIASNIPESKVVSRDGRIDFPLSASALYKQDTFVVLSASDVIGYTFGGFIGSNCGDNNPCGVTMLNNYVLTAKYIKDENTLDVYNIRQNNEPGQGLIYCSLDPLSPITTFKSFIVPNNTFVTLSAVPATDFTFRGWQGSPCSGRLTDSCSFNSTNNKSISGFFSRPEIQISVQVYGSGIFYIESQNKEINYGTFNLRNTKNVSTTKFISGSYVYLSAFGIGDTGILSLCAGDYNAYSLALDGDQILPITFMATKNITVSATGLADVISFVISKSGNSSYKNYNTVNYVAGGVSSIIESEIAAKSILSNKGDIVQIEPENKIPTLVRCIYTYALGNTGLKYNMVSNDDKIVYFVDENGIEKDSCSLLVNEQLDINDINTPVDIQILDGAPYYSSKNDILEWVSGSVECDLYTNQLSAFVVYEGLN